MTRSTLTLALVAQLLGGPALAGAPPAHAIPMQAVYGEPSLRCEFQRQLALRPSGDQRIARSVPDVPRLDLCGFTPGPARSFFQ